jgi:hypothetical protein
MTEFQREAIKLYSEMLNGEKIIMDKRLPCFGEWKTLPQSKLQRQSFKRAFKRHLPKGVHLVVEVIEDTEPLTLPLRTTWSIHND